MDPTEDMPGKENDYLTCGKCQLEFPLQKITTFMEHKKQECEGPDETGGGTLKSSGLQCVSCPKAFVTAVGMLLHAQATHNLQLFLTKGQYTAGIKNLMVSPNAHFVPDNWQNASNNVLDHELQVNNPKEVFQTSSSNVDLLQSVSSAQHVTISASIQPKLTPVPLTNSSCSNSSTGTLGVKDYEPNVHILPTATKTLPSVENVSKTDFVVDPLTDKNLSCSVTDTRVLVETQLLPNTMKNNKHSIDDVLLVEIQEKDSTQTLSSTTINKEQSIPALHQMHTDDTQNQITDSDLQAKTCKMPMKEFHENNQWESRYFLKHINHSKSNFKTRKNTKGNEDCTESASSDGEESVVIEWMNNSKDKDEEDIHSDHRPVFTDYKNSENLDPFLYEASTRCFETQGFENMKKCCSAVVPKKRKRHFETNHSQHTRSASHRHYPHKNINHRTFKHVGNTVCVGLQPQTKVSDSKERVQKFDKIKKISYNQRNESTQLSQSPNYKQLQVLYTPTDNQTKHSSVVLQPGSVVAIPMLCSVSTSLGQLEDSAAYKSDALLRLPRKPVNFTSHVSNNTDSYNGLPDLSSRSTEYMIESQPADYHSLPVDTIKNDRDKDKEGMLHERKRRYPTCRPFKCGQCDNAFNQRIHLKKHMSKHTGIKPFKCQQCDYSTVERSHLKVHIRIHTGEKPFKCLYCEYATAQNSTLKIHQKRHHDTPKE